MTNLKIPAFIFFFLLLAACGGNSVQQTLGLNRNTPDEFMVYSKPPLSVPPDFSLRAPGVGAPAGDVSNLREQARQTVFEGNQQNHEKVYSNVSAGEEKLLQNVGSVPDEARIREILTEEETVKATTKEEQSRIGSFLSKLGISDEESVVDAGKEKQRLEENERNNLPPTAGETEVLKPKKEGIINRIIE